MMMTTYFFLLFTSLSLLSVGSAVHAQDDNYNPPPNNLYVQTLGEIGISAFKSADGNLALTTGALNECIAFIFNSNTEMIPKCVTLMSEWNQTVVNFNGNNSKVISEILTAGL